MAHPDTLAAHVDRHAVDQSGDPAFISREATLTWHDIRERAIALAQILVDLGFEIGDRFAIWLPDGIGPQLAFSATERAGLVAVGIGSRAGPRELAHLLAKTGARGLLSLRSHRDQDTATLLRSMRTRIPTLAHHLTCEVEAQLGVAPLWVDAALPKTDREHISLDTRSQRADDLWLLNSTSGTTGMPKVVTHDQRRWFAFHEFACESGALSEDDVFMSVVPAPFGFGLWTRHVSPTLLGAPVVLDAQFDPTRTLDLLEEFEVTVLAAVTTQFVMLLEAGIEQRELPALRVLFTGGEAVPFDRAAAFEEATGAHVLQFYGSNETGAVSGTSLRDTREQRLRTAGRILPSMQVRLFDQAGGEVAIPGRGQPACKGPALSRGYWNDDAANGKLVRPDGWMLLGDLVDVDAHGYLTVIGRTDDFIIRGGKNISGPAVEAACRAHPAIAHCAAVAMPDAVFGERVCLFAELRDGRELSLQQLTEFLRASDVSIESWPERLETLPSLPRGSGGKLAKQQLRDTIRGLLQNDA